MMQRDKVKGGIGSGDKLPGVRHSGSASFTLVIRHLKVQITMERQMRQKFSVRPFINQLANWEQHGAGALFRPNKDAKALDALFGSTISLHLPNCAKKEKSCKKQTVINHTFILFLPYA